MPRQYKHTGEFYRKRARERLRYEQILKNRSEVKVPDSNKNLQNIQNVCSGQAGTEQDKPGEEMSVSEAEEDAVAEEQRDAVAKDTDAEDEDANAEDDDAEEALHNLFSFSSELKEWMLMYKITHRASTALLKLLIKCNIGIKLPSDSRTFLSTPRTVDIVPMGRGSFIYNGLGNCLREQFCEIKQPTTVQIKINFDGLPLNNSSKKEFWPILAAVDNLPMINVMVIAIYMGDTKPDIQLFLPQFVNEMNFLIKNGIEINGIKLSVLLKYFICDSPARCHLKGNLNIF